MLGTKSIAGSAGDGNETGGVFADHAGEYAAHGLRVCPTGGPDGKRPLVRGWQKAGRDSWRRWRDRFANANIGIVDGDPGGIVRVDIDTSDRGVVAYILKRCGDSPVKVATPTGGLHVWFQAAGERRRIKPGGAPFDILGRGGFGVAPPSVCPGKGAYEFLEGGLADLDRLPRIKAGALPPEAPGKVGGVLEGRRTDTLFRELRAIAAKCETRDELLFRARGINEAMMHPPLSDDEVAQQVRGVWKLRREGRCIVPGSRSVVLGDEILDLYPYPPALVLYTYLKRFHGGSDHVFRISPRGLASKLHMAPNTVARAREVLMDQGLIAPAKERPGEFRLAAAAHVSKFDTDRTYTPSPRSPPPFSPFRIW